MRAGLDPLAFLEGVREDDAKEAADNPAVAPKLANRFGAITGGTSDSGVLSKFELDPDPY